MTKKEIEEHFAMHKYAPLQEIYKTYSGGQKFNEGCYTCLAPKQNGNRKTKGRK